MNDNKIVIGIVISTIVLLLGIVFLASKMGNSAKVEASSNAKAVVKTKTYDWGKIGINNGKAEAEFDIENGGSQSLKLFNVTTSCACTTAQLITDKITSPLFGMHTKSNFVTEVDPGKTAKLKIVFDPLFHGPSGIGPISREVTVTTNDPNNPTLKFKLSANVIK